MSDIPSSPPSLPTPSSTNWRLYLELLTLSGFFIPFGHILGPLVLWLVKKDTDAVADLEGRKVLNFNLSWTLWGILSCGLGFLVWLVLVLIAIIKAANKTPFKHPLTIQFLK